MDSFTQIVLGIATAEVVAGRTLKNKTFLYGAVLGTLPDLDVVVGSFLSDVDGVAIHRGLSHSLLFFLLLSPVLGAVLAKIEKGTLSFKRATCMVFWCLTTHVLLDMFTSWGTQILWPLDHRFALKTIFVIDPLYTVPLLIALLYVFRNKSFVTRHLYVLRGLWISSGYLLLTCILKLIAVQKFETALAQQNIVYHELIVKPTAFNTILWNANIATTKGYYLSDYSFFDSKPVSFTYYPKDISLEKKLETSTDFKKLKKISEGWYLVTQQDGLLYFNDLRFGLLTTSNEKLQFAFSYVFTPTTNNNFVVTEVPKAKRDGKLLLQKIFTRLQGN
ncbi:metal-dependent hydrolase [Flavobacterium sp.]